MIAINLYNGTATLSKSFLWKGAISSQCALIKGCTLTSFKEGISLCNSYYHQHPQSAQTKTILCHLGANTVSTLSLRPVSPISLTGSRYPQFKSFPKSIGALTFSSIGKWKNAVAIANCLRTSSSVIP